MKIGGYLRVIPLSALLAASLFFIAGTGIVWGNSNSDRSGGAAATAGEEVEVTGELTVLFIDDFEQKSAKILYQLKDAKSGKVFNLHFSGEPPKKLRTGSGITVRGRAKDKDIYLFEDSTGAQLQEIVASAPAVAGEQKTIVIVADFLDAVVACSSDDIQSRIFTDPLNKSVDDLYQEMSFGQVWLTGDVVGPFTINYATTSACDIGAWASDADAAAIASGVDLSAFNRKIYVLPRTNPCNYTGVGTVGGSPSSSWIFRCDGSDTFAHEFGHNLGMHHASTPTNEYGDTSDIMGYGGFGLRQINGPHQDQMGWMSPEQMMGVLESGTYMISPIEQSPAEALAPQILIVPKPDTGESYYLSYRQPLGFDAGLSSTYLTGVNIHRHQPDSATRSYFLASLGDGQSFSDSVNNVTVNQLSHTSGYVTIQVQVGPAPVCIANAPTVNLSPAGQAAFGGSSLSYTLTLTNMDRLDCQPATFSLAASVPSGWSGSVSPATLTLAPGATASAVLTALSPVSASAGGYAITANISDAATGEQAASRTVTYTVLPSPACAVGSPLISLTPASQSGQPGATLNYSVTVTNSDSTECEATTFSLSRSVPSGWFGTVSPSTLTIQPGAAASATLSVTSATTAAVGNYAIAVNLSDGVNAAHEATANGTYSVMGDTTPPTAPSALTAKIVRGKVSLSWTASTDNVRVTGYKVWRNNAVVAQIAGSSYTDAAVTSGLTYTYFVTAFDAAGNSSGASNSAAITLVSGGGGKKK